MPATQAELEAILNGAAVAPITRGFLRITGPDATRWLNGMVTNSTQSLEPGEGNYNFLLNAQGRIQGDCIIYREPGEGDTAFLLETDQSQIEIIRLLLDRFIIMDDVELTLSENFSGILLAGPQALPLVMALGTGNQQAAPCSIDPATPPPQSINIKRTAYGGSPVSLILAHSSIIPTIEIWSDPATISNILTELHETDSLFVSTAALETFRIYSGIPRFGIDIRDRDLPQETNQGHALHFSKGCYLGQEIVERIRSRGQVHRLFTRFCLDGELPTEFPVPLTVDGKPAGELTSAAFVPLPEDPHLYALGYARREFLELRKPIAYAGGTATPAPASQL